MKKLVPFFCILAISLTAFADDSNLQSIVTGVNADGIASIRSLSAGTTGNSSFASGVVSVSCFISTPLNPEAISQPHYLCNLANSVKIGGDEGDQIAGLPFLAKGTTGNSSFSSGNVKVNCRISIPLNQDAPSDQHYRCVLSEG